MKSKKMNTKKTLVKEKKTERKERRIYSADEKCQAVLSIWSERRKPSEICKEMGVNWTILNQWQKKALSAMLKVLEPRRREEEDRGPVLGEKLEKLLKKTSQRVKQESKLEKRLEEIQGVKKK